MTRVSLLVYFCFRFNHNTKEMQKFNLKCFVLLLGLLLPAAWYNAYGTSTTDGHSSTIIKDEYYQTKKIVITQ